MSSLILEDGSGDNPAANTYVSRAECDAYHAEMGNSNWTPRPTSPASPQPEEPLGDAAIIRATRSIDRIYSRFFKGVRTHFSIQPLEWPRQGVVLYSGYDSDIDNDFSYVDSSDNIIGDNVIPQMLKQAIYEGALRELITPGSLTPDLERGGAIKMVKAGSVSVEYSDNAPAMTAITSISGVLAPLLKSLGQTLDIEVG